ncbi:dNTP triphosphohydrolase [candidate division KSB1 bacterium]|nr:dNTP triphosphohydrolase [candidate division KSB1 bacterium]
MNKFLKRKIELLWQIETQVLSPFAAKSRDWNITRIISEPEHEYRTSFQRDRDRIIHSRAFRRLKHKRQVFLTHYGDHYRTRMTHTLEVSQLARTMARTMGLNEDLTEAIALAHDLGHTPFGHAGEVVLHQIMSGRDTLNNLLTGENFGGFKHNYQSLRVVDFNEKKYSWNGLNLTAAVREGVLKHTRLNRPELDYPDFIYQGLFYELDDAATLEGQIVAVCDEIAQRTHDLEDGIRAGYVDIEQIRHLKLVKRIEKTAELPDFEKSSYLYRNRLIQYLINFLVTDVIDASLIRLQKLTENRAKELYVWFSKDIHPLQDELDRFIHAEIIATASDERKDHEAVQILRDLFAFFYNNPHQLPEYRLKDFLSDSELTDLVHSGGKNQKLLSFIKKQPKLLRAICDHIAGMTDNFAEQEIKVIHSKDRQNIQRLNNLP